MNISDRLEEFKQLIMDTKTIDLCDRIYLRNAITKLIREVKEKEKQDIEKAELFVIPECVSIKRENIG